MRNVKRENGSLEKSACIKSKNKTNRKSFRVWLERILADMALAG